MSNEYHDLMNSAYESSHDKASQTAKDYGYEFDKDLSDGKRKVFVKDGKPTIAYSGTRDKKDLVTDAALALGLYKHTKRYKQNQKHAAKVRAKYGDGNLTTVGHSLGGKDAETVGANKVITYNKGGGIKDIGRKNIKNQTDIRNKFDPISLVSLSQKGGKRKTIKNKLKNVHKVLRNHSLGSLRK